MAGKYEHLRPPVEALNITHDNDFIAKQTQNKEWPVNRNVFYSVQLFDAESKMVLQVHQALTNQGESFPNWWKESDTLRFIHEFGFNTQTTVDRIRDHFRWLSSFPGAKLSEQAKFLIETGVVYQLGRDKNYRPNLYIIFNKLNSISDNLNAVIEGLLHLLVLVREKMLLPYYVERWNFFLDCSGSNELSSGKNLLGKLYEAIRTNFPQTLERIILLEGGLLESFGAQFDPSQSRGLKDRVTILVDRNDPGLNQLIGKDQLEHKYGGAIPNSTVFWPPQATSNRNTVSKAAIEKRKLYFFKMHDGSNITTTQSEYRATTESNARSLSPQFASTAPDFNRPSRTSDMDRTGIPTMVEEITQTSSFSRTGGPATPANSGLPLPLAPPLATSPPLPANGYQSTGYIMESYSQSRPPKVTTTKEVKTYVAEEDVEVNPLDLKGKYKSTNYVVPNFNKTYHPRYYSDDYKNHTFGFNKAASQTDYEKEREKKVNSWGFKDLLGCTNR